MLSDANSFSLARALALAETDWLLLTEVEALSLAETD